MAIKPSELYASQVDTSDPAWPWGRAQNESTPTARNGTPFEQNWVSDVWGFHQALLQSVGDEPSGVPDKSGNEGRDSQMLHAIRAHHFNLVLPLPAVSFAGSHFTFSPTNGWEQTTTGGAFSGSFLYFPLGPFPFSVPGRRLYLHELALRIKPATHVGLPAALPGYRLYRQSAAGLEQVNNPELYQDASGSVGTYNGQHSIVGVLSTPLEITFDAALYIAVFGEYGANALTGLRLISLACALSDGP
jgi:hypothetical protein